MQSGNSLIILIRYESTDIMANFFSSILNNKPTFEWRYVKLKDGSDAIEIRYDGSIWTNHIDSVDRPSVVDALAYVKKYFDNKDYCIMDRFTNDNKSELLCEYGNVELE